MMITRDVNIISDCYGGSKPRRTQLGSNSILIWLFDNSPTMLKLRFEKPYVVRLNSYGFSYTLWKTQVPSMAETQGTHRKSSSYVAPCTHTNCRVMSTDGRTP